MAEPLIGYEVKALSNLIKRQMYLLARPEEEGPLLSDMQGAFIHYLYDHREREVFQRDLEERFSIRRSTATGILQLMERKDLLRREAVSYDARLKKLTLTPAAIAKHEAFLRARDRIEAKITEGISPEELACFFSVIARMKKNLE